MTAVFAERDINYDKGLFLPPGVEYFENRNNSMPPSLYCIVSNQDLLNEDQDCINMEHNQSFASAYSDKAVHDFFLEKWTRKIECIQSEEDEFLKEENIEQPNGLSINYTYQLS